MKHLDHCLGYVIWPELQEFSGVGQDISLEKNLAKHHKAHEHVQRHLTTGSKYIVIVCYRKSSWLTGQSLVQAQI